MIRIFTTTLEKIAAQLKTFGSTHSTAIAYALEARQQKVDPEKALKSFEIFDIPKNALEFVKRWITGEISFVRPSKPETEEKT